MGGEKAYCWALGARDYGSPPRGRGKVTKSFEEHGFVRITPAWAGKSCSFFGFFGLWWDHPRVGGEKCVPVSWATGAEGSPPRGRGKGGPPPGIFGKVRITPAWAGKSGWRASKKPLGRDHPRVGGEKRCAVITPGLMGGSPPRGRGKAVRTGILCLCFRITPAWAGKSA